MKKLINIPDNLKEYIDSNLDAWGFISFNEYINDLIRHDISIPHSMYPTLEPHTPAEEGDIPF